jgi:hypothetical protein
MKNAGDLDVVECNRRFGVTSCYTPHRPRGTRKNQNQTCVKQNFRDWRWKNCFHPKSQWSSYQIMQDITLDGHTVGFSDHLSGLWCSIPNSGCDNLRVVSKNGVFWVVTPCGSCKNRRFGGTWRLLHQADKNRWTRNNTSMVFLRSVRRLLVTASVVPSSPILVTRWRRR